HDRITGSYTAGYGYVILDATQSFYFYFPSVSLPNGASIVSATIKSKETYVRSTPAGFVNAVMMPNAPEAGSGYVGYSLSSASVGIYTANTTDITQVISELNSSYPLTTTRDVGLAFIYNANAVQGVWYHGGGSTNEPWPTLTIVYEDSLDVADKNESDIVS